MNRSYLMNQCIRSVSELERLHSNELSKVLFYVDYVCLDENEKSIFEMQYRKCKEQAKRLYNQSYENLDLYQRYGIMSFVKAVETKSQECEEKARRSYKKSYKELNLYQRYSIMSFVKANVRTFDAVPKSYDHQRHDIPNTSNFSNLIFGIIAI